MTDHGESTSKLAKYKLQLQETASEGDDRDSSLDGFFYIPEFISEQEEEYLIEKINTAPRPKWRELQARRSVDLSVHLRGYRGSFDLSFQICLGVVVSYVDFNIGEVNYQKNKF